MISRLLFYSCIYFTIILTISIAQQTSSQLQQTTQTSIRPHRSFKQWILSFFHRNNNKKQWDLIIFAQAYPVPHCALKTNDWCQTYLNQSEWIVLGIWPTRKDGRIVTECNKSEFDTASLQSILPQMKQHWPKILQNDSEFWEREWLKHGSCLLNLFKTELEYFKQGLEWNKKYSLAQILRDKKILPSNEKTYKYSDFFDTIHKAVGRKPYLQCHSFKNMSFIKEVRLCVSKKLKLLDCDKNYKQSTDCPKEGIMYPRTPDFYKKLLAFTNKIGQQTDHITNVNNNNSDNATDIPDLEQ